MKNDTVYLRQVLDAEYKIKQFIHGIDYQSFLLDQKTQSAVIMQLVLIGELTKRISKDTQLSITLPWKDIAGFRDRAIHDYYRIDVDIVWQTIIDDLPVLKKAISSYLDNAKQT